MDLNTLSVALSDDRAGAPFGIARGDLTFGADPDRPLPSGRHGSPKPCGNCQTCKCRTKPASPSNLQESV